MTYITLCVVNVNGKISYIHIPNSIQARLRLILNYQPQIPFLPFYIFHELHYVSDMNLMIRFMILMQSGMMLLAELPERLPVSIDILRYSFHPFVTASHSTPRVTIFPQLFTSLVLKPPICWLD